MQKKYFIIFPCCIPVKGEKRATICDIQRNKIELIPLALFYIITKFLTKNIPISNIKEYFGNQQDKMIDSYLDFLQKKEVGFYSDTILKLPSINTSFETPNKIENAIIDIDENSAFNIQYVAEQLSNMLCLALNLRLFKKITQDALYDYLSGFNKSTIRHLEIVLSYNDWTTVEYFLQMKEIFTRLHKITVYNAPKTERYEHNDISIVYCANEINIHNCGVVNYAYFVSNMQSFFKNIRYNSCLYKKIAISADGSIRNCPSMCKSYGNISNTDLQAVVNLTEFKKYWYITKNHIDTCKKCEFRYVCQDCRVFTTNPSIPFSKPQKCTYNPHKGCGLPI